MCAAKNFIYFKKDNIFYFPTESIARDSEDGNAQTRNKPLNPLAA